VNWSDGYGLIKWYWNRVKFSLLESKEASEERCDQIVNVLDLHLAFWAWFHNGARKIGQLLLKPKVLDLTEIQTFWTESQP
jgi:hypothetical protein